MTYNLNSINDDCYEGTSCLINKFGIADENKLSEIEANITLVKSAQLEENPINGSFDTCE